MLACFSAGEPGELLGVLLQKRPDRFGLASGMVAQGPPNGFTNEKIGFTRQSECIAKQPLLVGVFAPTQLVQHGHAAHPHVGMHQALVHGPLGILARVFGLQDDVAHHPRQTIYGVSPSVGLYPLQQLGQR